MILGLPILKHLRVYFVCVCLCLCVVLIYSGIIILVFIRAHLFKTLLLVYKIFYIFRHIICKNSSIFAEKMWSF